MASANEKDTANSSHIGEWLVNVADDVVVPMTTLEVVDGLRASRLSEQSLVWRIGMHDWTSIEYVPQLRLAASSRKPPSTAPRVTAPPAARNPAQSTLPNSLAPMTAEAATRGAAGAAEPWADFDQLLANERRADQRSSRRVVFWAAGGSAALAALFTLWFVRSPQAHETEIEAAPARVQAARSAEPSDLPAVAPALEASAAPSPAFARPTPMRVAPKARAPRLSRRPPRAPVAAPASDVPAELQSTRALNPTLAAPSVAVVPLDPAPDASALPEAAHAPSAPEHP